MLEYCILLVLHVLGTFFFFSAKTSKNSTGALSLIANLKEFILSDLERATSNFEEELGTGRSGKVYKGWVHKNTYASSTPDIGLPIAVKRFNPERAQGNSEWQVISLLHSPNIQKVHHHCLPQ